MITKEIVLENGDPALITIRSNRSLQIKSAEFTAFLWELEALALIDQGYT